MSGAQQYDQEYDYVIVGAGSSGCVLANRLSADAATRVCLIEAGPSDQGWLVRWLVNVPAGIFSLIVNPKYNWKYWFEPEEATGNRPIYCPRGRLLGGSSAINGMIYIRGHRADFDLWERLGATGWGYNDVLPYFKKSEDWHGGATPYHGQGGELPINKPRDPHGVCGALLEAAASLQYRANEDFNGAEQDGFGYFHLNQKNGERVSSARAFLQPVMNRPNLTVLTGALAEKVIIDNKRATGVALTRDGQKLNIRARREVILSGGAINSPQLLLLSGIGPGEQLRQHGIAVVHDLPGVGENLHDHQDVLLCWKSKLASLYGLSFKALPWMIASPFKYFPGRMGPFTTNTVEAGGFIRTLPELSQPDIQVILGPQYMNQPQYWVPRGHGFSIHLSLLQPKSRGRLTLRSADPAAAPMLKANFLSHPDDAAALMRGVKKTRQLVESKPFDKFRDSEILPGPDVKTDDEILAFVHQTLGTTFHPVGTCKMGSDSMAVVDPQLRVRGLDGLRVIDASVMPQVVSGNTNAPAIMIGEKGADLVLGRSLAQSRAA